MHRAVDNLNVDRNDPRFSAWKLLKLLGQTKRQLKRIENENLDCEQSKAVLKELIPQLRALSTCG